MTRTLSIAIKENTYQQLKQRIEHGKISSFVNQAVEKGLRELAQVEQQEKEQLKKELHSYKQNTLIKDGYLRAKENTDKK